MRRHPQSIASLCTSLSPWGELHAESSDEVYHSPRLGSEILAQTASSKYAFSSQMVAVQRSWVSQSSSKSGVTKPLLSGQYARGLFDLLFVHDFHSSPSRGTCCPLKESPPSRDTAQTLGGCSSAHMFLDSKFAKEKCILPPRYSYVLYWGFWQLHCKFLSWAGRRDRQSTEVPILDISLLFPLKYAKQSP